MRAVFHLHAALSLIAARASLDGLLNEYADDPDMQQVIRKLAENDPTDNYDWLEHMFKLYMDAAESQTDMTQDKQMKLAESIGKLAKEFQKWMIVVQQVYAREDKRRFQDFRSVPELEDVINVAKQSGLSPRVLKSNAEYEQLYTGEDGTVYRIDNHEAMCMIGSNTRWCSAMWGGEHYWDRNKQQFDGNTAYIVEKDSEHKFLVRISNDDGIIRVMRDQNDVIVNAYSSDYTYIVRMLQKANVIGPDTPYEQEEGGGWAVTQPVYGSMAGYASIIRVFGYSAAEWKKALAQEEARGGRIVVGDMHRLAHQILPVDPERLRDLRLREAFGPVSIERRRRALFYMLRNYATRHRIKKTRRTIASINAAIGGARWKIAQEIFLVHVLSGMDIKSVIELYKQYVYYRMMHEPELPPNMSALAMLPDPKTIVYIERHYDELFSNDIVNAFSTICNFHSPNISKQILIWAQNLQWTRRKVTNPAEELQAWIDAADCNPDTARILLLSGVSPQDIEPYKYDTDCMIAIDKMAIASVYTKIPSDTVRFIIGNRTAAKIMGLHHDYSPGSIDLSLAISTRIVDIVRVFEQHDVNIDTLSGYLIQSELIKPFVTEGDYHAVDIQTMDELLSGWTIRTDRDALAFGRYARQELARRAEEGQ